jgi:hypothetical protein
VEFHLIEKHCEIESGDLLARRDVRRRALQPHALLPGAALAAQCAEELEGAVVVRIALENAPAGGFRLRGLAGLVVVECGVEVG